MKKLFLLAAVFAALAINAEVNVPEEAWTLPTVPSEGWAGKATPTSVVKDGWTIFPAYELSQSAANVKWINAQNSGSTKLEWAAKGIFPAFDAFTWKNTGKDSDGNPIDDGPRSLTVRDDSQKKGPYSFRVKNVGSACAYVVSGNNGKRTIFLEAYELTGGVAGTNPVKSASTDVKEDDGKEGTIISISGLDVAKEYVFVVRGTNTGSAGTSDGNSTFNAIAFSSSTATAIDNTEAEVKAVKTFENGQLIIIKNGVKYNATGAVIE